MIMEDKSITIQPALEIHDLTVAFDRKPVLWDIDLTLPQGKLVGIIGPNGAGKSTLIKAVMGLLPLSSGYVKLFDQPIDEVRKRISYVPQRESVDWDFPASVLDIVMMGRYGKLGLFKGPRKADRDVAFDCLKKVGMESFANRQISQLSGGQQQRTFLARALAQQADIYFMDEPFAGVDAATEKAIISLLRTMTEAKKNSGGRPSRPAVCTPVFRLGDHAEHEACGFWSNRVDLQPAQPPGNVWRQTYAAGGCCRPDQARELSEQGG